MGIGNRRQIKLIEITSTLVDGDWENVETTILRTWAEVKNKNGSRAVQNNQTILDKFFEFRFRYKPTIEINANVKVLYNGKKYTIHSLERENEKDFYWILRMEAKSFS